MWLIIENMLPFGFTTDKVHILVAQISEYFPKLIPRKTRYLIVKMCTATKKVTLSIARGSGIVTVDHFIAFSSIDKYSSSTAVEIEWHCPKICTSYSFLMRTEYLVISPNYRRYVQPIAYGLKNEVEAAPSLIPYFTLDIWSSKVLGGMHIFRDDRKFNLHYEEI